MRLRSEYTREEYSKREKKSKRQRKLDVISINLVYMPLRRFKDPKVKQITLNEIGMDFRIH